MVVLPGQGDAIDTVLGELQPRLHQLIPGRRHADAFFVEEAFAIEEDDAAKVRGQAIAVAVVGAQCELSRRNRGEVAWREDVFERFKPASVAEGGGHEVVKPEHIQATVVGGAIRYSS